MIEEDPYSVPCFYPSSYIASRYKSLEKMMTGRDCVWKNKTKQNKKTRIYRRRVYMRGVSRFCVSSSSPHCCDENGLSIKIERDYPHPLLILGTIASNVKKKDKKKGLLQLFAWFIGLIYATSPRYPYFSAYRLFTLSCYITFTYIRHGMEEEFLSWAFSNLNREIYTASCMRRV